MLEMEYVGYTIFNGNSFNTYLKSGLLGLKYKIAKFGQEHSKAQNPLN